MHCATTLESLAFQEVFLVDTMSPSKKSFEILAWDLIQADSGKILAIFLSNFFLFGMHIHMLHKIMQN